MGLRLAALRAAGAPLLKDGCRQSATCDDSEDEDAFDPGEVVADEHLQGAEQPKDSGDTEQRCRYATGPGGKSRPRRTANTRISISFEKK